MHTQTLPCTPFMATFLRWRPSLSLSHFSITPSIFDTVFPSPYSPWSYLEVFNTSLGRSFQAPNLNISPPRRYLKRLVFLRPITAFRSTECAFVRLMARPGKGAHSVQTLPLSCMPFCPFVQFISICNQLFSGDQKHRYATQFRLLKTTGIRHFVADKLSDINWPI